MHRAMIHLLLDNFPRYALFSRDGMPSVWILLSGRPVAADPSSSAYVFDAPKTAGIRRPKVAAGKALTARQLGPLPQDQRQPTAPDPLARNPDPDTCVHNYLHNRWIYPDSDISLRVPEVNIHNTRFWRLHGWIEHQWWRFRRAKGARDRQAAYTAKVDAYKQMMSGHHVPHHHGAAHAAPAPSRFNVFQFD